MYMNTSKLLAVAGTLTPSQAKEVIGASITVGFLFVPSPKVVKTGNWFIDNAGNEMIKTGSEFIITIPINK